MPPNTTNGASRHFGNTGMSFLSELRRKAAVALSEINGHTAANDTDAVQLVSVFRRTASTKIPVAGVPPTYAAVAGLSDLTGKIRTKGQWDAASDGQRVYLGDAFRAVYILDLPAGGNGAANQLLLTDKLQFTDPTRGDSIWRIKQIANRDEDGICLALCEFEKLA
ncbi:MAG: hypothetical protein GY871_04505 [Actinomycetales bacterium]|nr:hypothetical protein [Actinomycetales bacterium]